VISPPSGTRRRRSSGAAVAEIRIDLEAWQGSSAEKVRADESDAVSLQDLGDLLAACLPSEDRHFGDPLESRQGVRCMIIEVVGAFAGRQDACDRGQAAQHHRESLGRDMAVWFKVPGGSVSSRQEDIDVGCIAGAVVREFRVLNDEFGDSVEIGDDPAEITLDSLRSTGPGAFAGH
jgi:hypothetical protein